MGGRVGGRRQEGKKRLRGSRASQPLREAEAEAEAAVEKASSGGRCGGRWRGGGAGAWVDVCVLMMCAMIIKYK